MRIFTRALWSAAAAILFVIPAFSQTTDELPEANPCRPTVSTPATLTPIGYLQFENGVLYADTSPDFSTRFGANQVTKLTLNSRVQVFGQFEPLVHATGGDTPGTRFGDVYAGVQAVMLPGRDRRPTVSASYIARVYDSPAPDVDIGAFRQSALLLVSDDLAGFHFDLNGMAAEQVEDGPRRAQFGQSLSISHPIGRFTVSGEVWHFSQPLIAGNAVGNLWAVSYAPRKNLVLDVGFDHGLTGSSTQWELVTGFTYVLPHRLWKQRGLHHQGTL